MCHADCSIILTRVLINSKEYRMVDYECKVTKCDKPKIS